MLKNLFLIFSFFFISCNTDVSLQKNRGTPNYIKTFKSHDSLGLEVAKHQIKEMLSGEGQPFSFDTLIKKPEIAIAIAEPLLFDVFGQELITHERPYEISLIDGYWYISGKQPEAEGGAFEIILSARNGKVFRLTHYK